MLLKANYQGSTHKTPNTSALVWRIANKARNLQLQKKLTNWEGNSRFKVVVDLRRTGREKFERASLATFNKKMEAIKSGSPDIGSEDDEMSAPDFMLVVLNPENETDGIE